MAVDKAVKAARLAGPQLDKAIGMLLGTAGDVATEGTRVAMKNLRTGAFGINKMTGVPQLLREGSKKTPGLIPELVGAGTQVYLGAKGVQGGMNAIGSMVGTNKQQSKYSQPMSSGMEKFLYDRELQNLKFQNQLGLMLAKAEATNPGVQYANMAEAEKTLSEAGEITNAEVLQVARSIYGTGLRV